MDIALGLLTGFLAGRFLRVATAHAFRAPALARRNYRGVMLPTAVGILVPIAALIVEGGRTLAGAAGVGANPGTVAARPLMVVAVLGFGMLGLLDDLAGDPTSSGFVGHVRTLVTRGELTTGAIKLLAGAGLALVLVVLAGDDTLRSILRDGALVALAANLANLLDRAPGRALKGAFVAYVPLMLVAGTAPAGVAVAPVVGAALALLRDDLRERVMLGDAGSNAIGAALGLTAVLALGPVARTVVAAVLAVLNAVSERLSFSAVIERVAPLRALDRLGRPGP